MSWQNVLWIWRREMRDQLRDRRTLFMVAVLPVLMYPLLGSSFFQLSQFMRQTVGRVLFVGADELDALEAAPPLLEGDRFAAALFLQPADRQRLVVTRSTRPAETDAERLAAAQAAIDAGETDVVVVLPEGFATQLNELRRVSASDAEDPPALPQVPQPTVLRASAREASQVARLRVIEALRTWNAALGRENLAARNVPVEATQPFAVGEVDISPQERRDAALWAKLLPFVVFIWALTGAFYPAIDVCAGEKERGTLETLLSSPARRSEIVLGKMLTVMAFSIFTACLNLASLTLTAQVLIGQLSGMLGGAVALSPPPLSSLLWLIVALVPVAALFSALSLALAALARSTKEGQYYFMPLFLAATPLMLVPMSPGVELTLGNSLMPVMGLVLLLRTVVGGDLALAATHTPAVIAVTAACCWLAIRWAVSQFNDESVLFREGERADARKQLAAWWRRRGATPSPALAIVCVLGIFLARFVLTAAFGWWSPAAPGFGFVAASVIATQLFCIALPAALVGLLMVRDRRATFLVGSPCDSDGGSAGTLRNALLGVGIAAGLHPLAGRLAAWIHELHPVSDELNRTMEAFGGALGEAPSTFTVLLLFALLPAVCEELAFRGVILSGLRKALGNAGGVVVTAIAFAATHTVMQQSLAAAPVGVVLGFVALRSRSIWPCISMHAVYNALLLLSAVHADAIRTLAVRLGIPETVFIEIGLGQLGYAAPVAMLGSVLAVACFWALGRRSYGQPRSSLSLAATTGSRP